MSAKTKVMAALLVVVVMFGVFVMVAMAAHSNAVIADINPIQITGICVEMCTGG